MQKIDRNRWLLVFLCLLLVLEPVLTLQASAQGTLRIVIVEGREAKNVIQQIPPRPLTVRVEDANGRPVVGATVVFTAPQSGPSGDFENDSRNSAVMTRDDGLAVAELFHPNDITGPYVIRVRAEFQSQNVVGVISQTNVTPSRGRGKWFAVVAIVGVAAGAAYLARSKKNNSSTAPTITFGGSAVGAPR